MLKFKYNIKIVKLDFIYLYNHFENVSKIVHLIVKGINFYLNEYVIFYTNFVSFSL